MNRTLRRLLLVFGVVLLLSPFAFRVWLQANYERAIQGNSLGSAGVQLQVGAALVLAGLACFLLAWLLRDRSRTS